MCPHRTDYFTVDIFCFLPPLWCHTVLDLLIKINLQTDGMIQEVISTYTSHVVNLAGTANM